MNNMNLQEALTYTEEKLAEGKTSDGCTASPDLGIKRFCVMHDMLRRFKPVSKLRADNLFFQGIMTKGLKYLPVAITYWYFVRWQAFTGDMISVVMIHTILIIIGLLMKFA